MSKNCILYLVRTSEADLQSLNHSLSLLDENILNQTGMIDVILFHEASFTQEYKNNVRSLKNGNTIFQQVDFTVPDIEGIPEIFPHPSQVQRDLGNAGFSIGYRHMCWFFSGGLYEQPIMNDYKYYLRLDTDSEILTPITYDIFNMMERGEYKYGYIEDGIQQDSPDVVIGLWDFVGSLYNIAHIPEGRIFYTNIEIGHVQWFKNGPYKSLFKQIEANGGVYVKRWGDAPIKYIGVNLFMPTQNMVAIKGFTYKHGATYNL